MPTQISIIAKPNQSFSVRTPDDVFWNIRIFEINDCMACDITKDNITILQGQRIVSGTPLIPYAYIEGGNFVLDTLNDLLPWWDRFGIDQFLYYWTIEELAEVRA